MDTVISGAAARRTVKNREGCRRTGLPVVARSLGRGWLVWIGGMQRGCCSVSRCGLSLRLSGRFSCLNPMLLETGKRVQQDF